nr:unnamed protein product [Callosobruchus chinensis]
MENLFSMWKVRELADKVTNVVMNYTEIEAKVREATNDEPWGPTGQIMQDLAHSTFTYEHFPEVMSMLWKRMLQDNKQHWRRTYKSLLVLHYLVKNGSERVVTSAREHIYDLRSLENYTYIDDVGKDQGVNIRHKVKEMIDFIQDDDRLREERKKAKKNKDKFIGMSSDMMTMRFGKYQTTTSPTHGVDKQSSSPAVFEKKVNLNLSTNAVVSSPSKKQNRVLKKVDLGAAANFGRGASQHSPAHALHLSDDLLTVEPVSKLPPADILDFDPRADSTDAVTVTSQPDQAAEFGDFDTAFGSPAATKPSDDGDFADFKGAFMTEQQQFPVTHTAPNPLVGHPLSPVNQTVSPAIPSVSAVQAPAAADLLGDLDFSSLKIQEQTASHIENNNITLDSPIGPYSDGLNSDCADTRKKHHTAKKKSLKKPRMDELQNKISAAIRQYYQVSKITYLNEAEDLMRHVEGILAGICGILELDEFVDGNLDGVYGSFINILLGLFDDQFPTGSEKAHELINSLFSIEDPMCFEVTYRTLMRHLNADTIPFLEPLLHTYAFFLYTYRVSLERNEFVAIALEDEWQRYVTLLVSTPNRVANVLKGQVPDFFMVENFTNYIFLNILQLIECYSESIAKNPAIADSIRYECTSVLLGRVLLNLYQENSFDGAKCFVNILALITNYATYKIKEYRRVVQAIVSRLERASIEMFAKMVLSCLDPKKFKAEHIFGKVIVSNPQWEYTLCTKIPMLKYHGYHYNNLIVNLCVYMSAVSTEAHSKLLFDLSHIWADYFSMTRSSVEERVYFAKLLVCLVKTLPDGNVKGVDCNTLQQNIRRSVPMHLESTIMENRVLGMRIGELLLNHFSNTKEKMKFDYEGMGKESLKILEELQYMADKKFETELETVNEVQAEIERLFKKLQDPNKEVPGFTPAEIYTENKIPIELPKDENVIDETNESSNITILDPTDFDLDSDDDLQPYDTSDDAKGPQIISIHYLRDVKEALLETESADKFEVALQKCESLVISQLPNDDAALGIELLEILISLEPRQYMETFETLVLNSCVAVVSVYPTKYTEYICKQIHAGVGAYSISKRIFMIDVLVGSAKYLSDGVPVDTSHEERLKKDVPKEPTADEIIRERLKRKTRYFSNYRPTKRAHLNKFAEVAAYYFFPLLFGFQPSSTTNNNVLADQQKQETQKVTQPVGRTWGNINIDLDNLLVSKPSKDPSPSMNQLATNSKLSPVWQGTIPITSVQHQNGSHQNFANFK